MPTFFARLGLALSLMATSAFAQPNSPLAPVKIKGVSSPVPKLLSNLQKITLQDLQYADALARAHNNAVAHACWAALIDFMQAEEKAATGPDGNPLVLPTPHLITDAERAIDLANALQPNSTVSVACAPLANEVKTNVLSLITALATGAFVAGVNFP